MIDYNVGGVVSRGREDYFYGGCGEDVGEVERRVRFSGVSFLGLGRFFNVIDILVNR